MKRFKRLKFDAIALIGLGVLIDGIGVSFDLAFVTSIGYFTIAMNIIMFIAWRILEEIEENKRDPEFKEKISPTVKNIMTAGIDKIKIEEKKNEEKIEKLKKTKKKLEDIKKNINKSKI